MTLLLPMAYSLPTAEQRKMPIIQTSVPRVLAVLAGVVLLGAPARVSADTETIRVAGAGFALGASPAIHADTNQIKLALQVPPTALPFAQSAVKQNPAPALLGPDSKTPYFTVRFALPVPPDNDTNLTGALTGLDPAVLAHNHSPGFEILPNGDALAVYFSAKSSSGANESGPETCFVQARLRYGADQWDPPELFFDFKGLNDQSGLLWNDGGTLRFFGGGRGASPWLPFKLATSTNHGATWTLSLPQLDRPATDFTPQPIANAFRDPIHGAIFFAMDAEKDESFLWRSTDGGVHWHDMGGRTSGRHSTMVPLDDNGNLLSIGGKNSAVNGWSPVNLSTNWGASWSTSTPSAFPPLGGNQRPCLIRLANGHLCFVTDSYHRKSGKSPDDWKSGKGAFVSISTNNGATWRIKQLPVALPHEADRNYGTLGYATVRQAPNGVIHILATMTQPCLHYELNEAWVFSDAGDLAPETSGGEIRKFSENFPGGRLRIMWNARICPNGRYLLEGTQTTFYENGHRQHEVNYAGGCKTGPEIFWLPDGTQLWSWNHDLKTHTSVWTQYWPNGARRLQSTWNTRPEARDLKRGFAGLVADGPAYACDRDGSLARKFNFTNGVLAGEVQLRKSDTQ